MPTIIARDGAGGSPLSKLLDKKGGFMPFVRRAEVRCVLIETDRKDYGSGVLLERRSGSDYGIVLTNYHVLGDREVKRVLVNGREAKLLYYDFKLDFAALAVPTRTIYRIPIQENVEVGDDVFYVANPMQQRHVIGAGRILGKRGVAFRLSNPFADGCCGGGVFSIPHGRLIGIIDSINHRNELQCIPGKKLNELLPECYARLRKRSFILQGENDGGTPSEQNRTAENSNRESLEPSAGGESGTDPADPPMPNRPVYQRGLFSQS
jgi:hypothetical protein